MGSRMLGEKRGPKIGDAASLWNFTPSPGWTKEEAQILKLCLMKFGVGRWVQILDTGLLPGKLIQQLNGQTQRLLGQQSLAAYTGLQIDIDRVRADNETRSDAPRKAGLIINTGSNLTKEMKEKLQEEAKSKYGLTPEQIREVQEQLEDLAAQQGVARASSAPGAGVDLLECDADSLSKAEKIELLRALHARLQQLHDFEVSGGSSARARAAIPSSSDGENRYQPLGAARNGSRSRLANGSTARKENASAARKKGKNGRAATGKRLISARQKVDDDDEGDDEDCFGGRNVPGGTDERNEAHGEAMELEGAADAADLATLVAMGFSERQARDALEEAGGNIDAAAEWLVVHCV